MTRGRNRPFHALGFDATKGSHFGRYMIGQRGSICLLKYLDEGALVGHIQFLMPSILIDFATGRSGEGGPLWLHGIIPFQLWEFHAGCTK